MIDIFTRKMRNLNVETELLEELDWDEELLSALGDYLISSFQNKTPIIEIRNSVEKIYGVRIWKIIERQISLEMEYLKNIPEA